MKALVFDTETTGLIKHPDAKPELQPKIVEFGGVLIDSKGVEIDSFETLINPGRAIPEETIKVHGITDEMVKDEPSFLEVQPKIAALFKQADIMVAHNLSFDTGMLLLELEEIGLMNFPWPALNFCTVQENVGYYGYRVKLVDLYSDVLGIPLVQNHRAIDDCRALIDIIIEAGYLERYNSAN